jgi:hypothetical protein
MAKEHENRAGLKLSPAMMYRCNSTIDAYD